MIEIVFTSTEISTVSAGPNPAISTGVNKDYNGVTSVPLVFRMDEEEVTFDIQINDDSGLVDYEDETFDVVLDASIENRGMVQPNRGTVRVTIVNDDSKFDITIT